MTTLSPNYDERCQPITMLVLHYTGMLTAEAALARLCDAAAKVSAHYLIEENGTITALVPEDKRAWHAGVACWRGVTDVNSASIGIELVNKGHEWGYEPFPAAQVTALIELARGIITRHTIAPVNVVGHSDVAPTRKLDPGELFPWQELAAQGIGLWPRQPKATDQPLSDLLARYGYDVTNANAAEQAFYRHFYPAGLTQPDAAHAARLVASLLDQIGDS